MTLPGVVAEVVVADFDTEFVVLVPQRRRAHHLDPLWAVVFDSCRNGGSRESLVDDIVGATGWDRTVTAKWVDDAVEEFRQSGIVFD